MGRTSTYDLHDRLLNGDLARLLSAWRAEDPPRSFDDIAAELAKLGTKVSRTTVHRWCREHEITT